VHKRDDLVSSLKTQAKAAATSRPDLAHFETIADIDRDR